MARNLALCRSIALRQVYGDDADRGLSYLDLKLRWSGQGLRNEDLEKAIAFALLAGDVRERRFRSAIRVHFTPAGLARGNQMLFDHPNVAVLLDRLRMRRVQGLSRRRSDQVAKH